jgi:hypothetical protein
MTQAFLDRRESLTRYSVEKKERDVLEIVCVTTRWLWFLGSQDEAERHSEEREDVCKRRIGPAHVNDDSVADSRRLKLTHR